MPTLNHLSSSDLFRFVNVRGPMKLEESPSRAAFVPLIYDEDAGREATSAERLYPHILKTRGSAKQLDEVIGQVRRYRGGKDFIASVEDYATAYPQLTDFIGWLDVNAETASPADLKRSFEAAFSVKPKAMADDAAHRSAQFRIWDNLFANLFLASDAELVSLACKYLGTLNLIDLLARDAVPEHAPGLVYRSRPLVPKWIATIAASMNLKPDEGVEDQSPTAVNTLEDLKRRFAQLTTALTELDQLDARKHAIARERQDAGSPDADGKSARPGKSSRKKKGKATRKSAALPLTVARDAVQIDSGDLKTLGKDTVRLLADRQGQAERHDLGRAREMMRRDIVDVGAAMAERSRTTAFKIGGAVIESRDFCADIGPKDPCARSARVPFASRGSFVTSSLIGDLLITRQQLIKYDLGEVAHVETAMAGLEKQRTHRRLNRTEETDFFETTSTIEEERETQTTDRFEMEKETTRALDQNFQIDAGVSATGSYGTVNFSSSLDTSYGTSSSQSQADATSFSQEVTSRALSRVKETVRRSKTVAFLNETEETSVNTLNNATSDNINGVYRWVDRYYLNKIVNYGKRLMFEFAVPEPAQFHVFRQVTRPLPGNAVDKPLDPRETRGPDGRALNTPSDLSDANYSFWASLYGATGVDAPPPETVKISESWKNAYATSQGGDIYDSFSVALRIPDQYEAIAADVRADHYWWDADGHTMTGTIGTAYFAAGLSSVVLPNVSGTLGVSLLSYGMNWKLNAVVTCKRSSQLYDQWRTKAYGAIIDAYAARLREYKAWLQEDGSDNDDLFTIPGQNPGLNRETEREELKKRCLELFTGQRFESFDAAVDGVFNVSNYPEILFAEAVREGNIVKFFEQAFDWANMTYIFYPYFWGRKSNWLNTSRLVDPGDPLFTKFLQAGYARVVVPVRPGFENYLMLFHIFTNLVSSMGCSWAFQPSVFGTLGLSNTFSPAIDDPTYISVAQELQSAAGYNEADGPIYGTPYVQKVPTSLVYIAQNTHVDGDPWPGLPDNSADPDIAPYL